MKYRMLAAVFAIHPLAALAQNACSAQPVPLKPPSVSCSNAAPVCVTDQNGINGRWAWGCPTQTPQNSVSDFAGTLNNGIAPNDSPMDAYRKAVQLRQQREQTELLRQQTEALRQETEALRQKNESLTRSNQTGDIDIATMRSYGGWNGHAWQIFSEMQRHSYVDTARETLLMSGAENLAWYFPKGATNAQVSAAIDVFYSDLGHLWVPIHFAIVAAKLQIQGADAGKVSNFVSELKEVLDKNTTRR